MKLRYGYLLSGIAIGLTLLFSFIFSLPDGKLHVVFCNVGQGDGAYIRFPDGRDMVVDGGPDDTILQCLGKYMPFWDRKIDIVALSHPQKDHMQGLLSVLSRYTVGYFMHSDIDNKTQGYDSLVAILRERHIPVELMTRGDVVAIGTTFLSMIWPSAAQIAKGKEAEAIASHADPNVLAAAVGDLNDYSMVFALRYGTFDVVFPGDADNHVEANYAGVQPFKDPIEVLKVPHHGSRTGMTQGFVDWVRPKLAVISVGKNSYGQPDKKAVDMLQSVGSRVLRTDQRGDIEVVSDGTNWIIK